MIAFAWTVDFFIRTDAALSFAAPDGGEGEFAGYLIPVPEVRYPWNEFRGRKPSDDLVDE